MASPIDSVTVSPCHRDTAGLAFNPAKPLVMHLDLNSCFASVEQQANPLLRHSPVAVAAYTQPYGCILAPSIEAKLYGIKTGMTVAEGRERCPYLIVREADPPKYRQVHHQIGQLLQEYSPHVISKSIDEYAVSLPSLGVPPWRDHDPSNIALSIKSRIQSEIGDYLRVSIGVSCNQILAKLASGLHKPDGFDVLDHTNYLDIYRTVELQDFCGINVRNEARLHRVGIFTGLQFYHASLQTLKQAFQSVLGRYWYTRLRGYELDDVEFARRSFGQSYVLPHPMAYAEWRPILAKLVSKAARRLRASGYSASSIHLALRYSDHTSWHTGHHTADSVFDDASLFSYALSLYHQFAPHKPVKKVTFTCFGLTRDNHQLSCLRDLQRDKQLVTALDQLNDKWGEYTVTHGSMLGSLGHVRDAIAFGK